MTRESWSLVLMLPVGAGTGSCGLAHPRALPPRPPAPPPPGRPPPRPAAPPPAAPPRLIGRVRCVVEVEFFFQAPAGLKEPIAALLRDRACLSLPFGVERATALADPGAAAFRARDELPRIERDGHRRLVVGGRLGGLSAFALQTLLGLAQRLAPALARAQMLGQLVTALAAVQLVLAPIRFGRFGEDLPRDLAEVAVGVHRRVGRDLRAGRSPRRRPRSV